MSWETITTIYLLIGVAMMLSRWVMFFQERKKLMRNVLELPTFNFWMIVVMLYISVGSLLLGPYILIDIVIDRIKKIWTGQ